MSFRSRLGRGGRWIFLAAGLAGLLVDRGRGADRFWVDPGGGVFNSLSNWSTTSGGASGASVPGAADNARFDLPNTYDVEFLAGVTNQVIFVDDGSNVTMSLGGQTYTLTGNPTQAGLIGVTTGETGRLTLRNGIVDFTLNTDQFIVGFDLNATGFLTVTQQAEFGSAVHPNLFIGNLGPGTLTVNNGGIVRTTGTVIGQGGTSTGTATITGLGSSLSASSGLTVGQVGVASLTLNAGATMSTGGADQIAASAGSIGSASVSGAGSQWTSTGSLTVGGAGAGTLAISSGGVVSHASNAVLGTNNGAKGVVSVSGAGSRWSHGVATIGSAGQGTLTVSGGGEVNSSGNSIIGSSSSSSGAVTVTGSQSRWTFPSLNIGSSGAGALDILAGGSIVGNNMTLGINATGVGNLTVSGTGSAANLSGVMTIGNNGAGTVTVEDGGQLTSGSVILNDPAGTPVGTLNLRGGSITTGAFTRNGSLNFTDGTLTVTGTYDHGLAATALTIDGADADDLPTLRLIGGSGVSQVTSITVGNSRAAILEVLDDRSLNLGSNNVNIAALSGSQGTLAIRRGGSVANPSGTMTVGGQGLIQGGQGTLLLESDGVLDTGTLVVFPGSLVRMDQGFLELNAISFAGGTLDWQSGTVSFKTPQTLNTTLADFLLGQDHRLGFGRALRFDVTNLTLSTPLLIDGGSLSVGLSFANSNLLTLRSGSATVANVTNNSGGVIVMEQTGLLVASATFTNNGTLQLVSQTSSVTGATILNSGTIRGTGLIANPITNNIAGQIQTTTGQRLEFGAAVSNAGSISLVGGEMQFNAAVTNVASTGAITVRDAIVRFGGGLTNNGSLAVTFGTSDLFGDIANTATGRIVVSGGSQATFYDDVVNSGTMNVSASGGLVSTAVFFGSLSGNGIAGAGRVFNEGDLRPGFSPGIMAFGGDLSFGPLANLEIEIGGAIPGTLHDQVTVANGVYLDGMLDVTTINGFTPMLPGQSFTVVTAAARTGEFAGIFGTPNATLSGLFWEVAYTPTSAILTTSALAGDIDLDGDVDRRDVALFASHFGHASGAFWTTGDFNGDGATNLFDLALQQANLGAVLPSPSASPAAVPEPSTMSLAVLAGTLLTFYARTRLRSPCVPLSTIGRKTRLDGLPKHYDRKAA